MIIRIYRVQIDTELRQEFETQFQKIAKEFMQGRAGLVSVDIGKPTPGSPGEYVMVSKWTDIASVKSFAGEHWDVPVIPEHMRKFTKECWLHQFESFD